MTDMFLGFITNYFRKKTLKCLRFQLKVISQLAAPEWNVPPPNVSEFNYTTSSIAASQSKDQDVVLSVGVMPPVHGKLRKICFSY